MNFPVFFDRGFLRPGKALAVSLILVLAVALFTTSVLAASFPDTEKHWAQEPVSLLAAAGVVRGYPDGGFRPEQTVTRAEVAQMLIAAMARLEEADAIRGRVRPFPDVPPAHWASGAITLAREYGLVEGDDSGRYQPERPVTRLELTAILVRALGWPEGGALVSLPFADADTVPAWGRAALAVADRRGLAAGYEDGTFRPESPVTRAEAAMLIMRFMERRGTLYAVSGELVQPVDGSLRLAGPGGTAVIRLPSGSGLEIYRNGHRAQARELQPLDWIGVIFDRERNQMVVRAQYADLKATLERTDPRQGLLGLRQGGRTLEARTVPGARLYLNGRPSRLSELRPGDRIYAVWQVPGMTVRAVDAVRLDVTGVLLALDPGKSELVVRDSKGERRWLTLAEGARLYRHGEPGDVSRLQVGDRVGVALDGQGRVDYLEVWE